MVDTTTKRQDTYSAVRWSAASKYGAMFVQFAVSLLLARLLAPEYFGLLGMATVVTGFAKTLKSLGFNAAIIQRKDMDHSLLSTLFWVNLGFCSLITVILLILSPAAAWIYNDARVTPIVAALSLNILINSFCTIPSSLLQRKLEFKKLAIREIGGVLTSGVTGISCALMGWGVWSLVAASFVSSVTHVVLLNIVEPFWPSRVLDRERLKDCLKFGLNITGLNIFNYFAKNMDSLIIGIHLGPLALGYYSLARRFMVLPRDSISRVISRVLFPKLSEFQDSDERLANAFLRAVSAIALVSFPAMTGLALVASPFVNAFLGQKWLPAIPVISTLAAVGAIQSLTILTGAIYLSKGRADWLFRWSIVVSLVYVAAFLAGIYWGLNGVATCYLLANILLFIPDFAIPFKLVEGLSISRLSRVLAPFAFATVGMSIAVIAVSTCSKWYFNNADSPAALGISVITGMASYSLLMLALRPPALGDYCSLILGSRLKLKLKFTMSSASSTTPIKDKT